MGAISLFYVAVPATSIAVPLRVRDKAEGKGERCGGGHDNPRDQKISKDHQKQKGEPGNDAQDVDLRFDDDSRFVLNVPFAGVLVGTLAALASTTTLSPQRRYRRP